MRDQPPGLRGLKILVAVLGVLVVLGTTLVIAIIIQRIYAGAAVTSMPAGAPEDPAVAPRVALAAGTRITAIAAAGGALAVAVTGPAGDQLWLVNPRTGARILAISAAR